MDRCVAVDEKGGLQSFYTLFTCWRNVRVAHDAEAIWCEDDIKVRQGPTERFEDNDLRSADSQIAVFWKRADGTEYRAGSKLG